MNVAFSDLFRRRDALATVEAPVDPDLTFPTKALSKFLMALNREQPVILDLGPVVGQNVSFFGEQLGCKIIVEDVFSDIERHVASGTLADLPSFFSSRFLLEEGSVDGILAWDVCDYLERPAAQALAHELIRALRPTGVLLGFFGTAKAGTGRASYTRHIVTGESTLRHKEYPAGQSKQPPMANRDIMRLFEPLEVSEQFLLTTSVREVLFRKPAA